MDQISEAGASTIEPDTGDRPGTPSGATGPRPVPEADVFRFDEVDQAGGRAHGPPVRRGMVLVFDGRGIEIAGPEPSRHAFLPWSAVTWISFGAGVVGPDGRTETPVEVESTAGLVRYVVRSDRPPSVAMSALEERVHRWSSGAEAGRAEGGRADADPAPAVSAGAAPRPAPPARAAPVPDFAPPVAPVPQAPPARPESSTGPRRTRRTVTLVLALCLVVGGIGLAVGLSLTGRGTDRPTTPAAAAPAADRQLAQELMLTKADLPAGWRVAKGSGVTGTSPTVQRGETVITRSLAACMGITEAQAALVLGGRAADQTAQTSSPIFMAPTASASAGSALELQTAATVVRSHLDEQTDFALFANPKYPSCAATASAAELQLGVDQTSGTVDQPGPATVSPVTLPSPDGVQLTGLLMSFTVKAGAADVPVQVEAISLGSHRVEASLQVFAIGGPIPSGTLAASVSTFEQRVASGGKSSVV